MSLIHAVCRRDILLLSADSKHDKKQVTKYQREVGSLKAKLQKKDKVKINLNPLVPGSLRKRKLDDITEEDPQDNEEASTVGQKPPTKKAVPPPAQPALHVPPVMTVHEVNMNRLYDLGEDVAPAKPARKVTEPIKVVVPVASSRKPAPPPAAKQAPKPTASPKKTNKKDSVAPAPSKKSAKSVAAAPAVDRSHYTRKR